MLTLVHICSTPTPGQWQKLDSDAVDQIWLDGELWQRRSDRSLTKLVHRNNVWQGDDVPLKSRLCRGGRLAAINGEIWIAQQGVRRIGGGARRVASLVRRVPCGVVRYNPRTGEETFYDQDDGLNSGFGRDIAGDARQVWVSHSVKHNKLSLLDLETGQWQTALPFGTGNVIALSQHAVWAASPSPRDSLMRIDRMTQQRQNIRTGLDDFYVSTIAIDGTVIWLGLYKKSYTDTSYTVESYLARYDDRP